ncbi:MAG: LysM peptidoglycan-binding domain-containing protein [Bacteroidales bacterium]|nr:MAG: LysM peptidoglycan-binding domain-containing protein [Bacteroidales bacterium]
MHLKRIFFIITIILFFYPLYAQTDRPTQVKKSTDRVIIEGKYFYIHIVCKGESLYSISKAYGVSQMEIAMENADIYLGIKVDMALKIPAKDLPKTEEDERFIYHIVKKGETLFGLSKQYQVPIDEIAKVNLDVESGLILNQVLLIPRDRLNTVIQATRSDSGMYIYHQVKPKEGLYSISRQYNVNIQTIEDLNKEVLSNGLKFGSILKIPQKPSTSTTPNSQSNSKIIITNDVIASTAYSVPHVKCDTFNYSRSKRVFNISLLLPLLPDKEDSDSTEYNVSETGERIAIKQSEPEKISLRALNFLDFYQGFLLAVDSLKRGGLSLSLSVYNTSKSVSDSKRLLTEKGIKESDLIVGPVYPELLKPFADFSRENRINVVSPLSHNDDLLKGNPFYFQVNPSPLVQFDEFTSKVDFCSEKNLLFIYEDDSLKSDNSADYKALIANRIKQCENSESLHFKELKYAPGGVTAEIKEKLNQSMTDQKENVFIIPSENEAFVSDFLSHLFALTTYYNYKVKVYGFPKWQKFKNVPVDYFYRLNIHLFTPYYVDYTQSDVKRFVADYRHYYRSEPSQYSFQGYDIGFYFLSAMKKYGVDFKYCLQNLDVDLLQSNYRFIQQSSVDGFDNKSVFLINYTQDFDIVLVK